MPTADILPVHVRPLERSCRTYNAAVLSCSLQDHMRHAIIRSLSLLVLLSTTGGCASFYLHDAATQQATDSAHSALAAVNLGAVFDSQSNYLDDLEKNETAAVTAAYAAQRDHEILLFIDGTGPSGDDGLTTLQRRIDGYLLALAGVADRRCEAKLWRALQDTNALEVSASPEALTGLSNLLTQFHQQIQKPCSHSPFHALPIPGDPEAPLASAISKVQADLNAIDQLQQEAKTAQQTLQRELSAAEAKFAAGNSDADALEQALDKFKTALTDANPLVRQFASKELSTRVAAAIDAFSPQGTNDSAVTQQARSGIAVVQALAGVGDAYATPPRIPHPNALAAAQSWLNYVASTVATDLQNQQTLFKDHRTQLASSIAAAYFLSKAGEETEKIEGSYRMSKIGKAKCPLDDALRRKVDKKTFEKAQRKCGTKGLADLFDASDGGNTRAINGAILYYASAWTRGFAANDILSRRGNIDRRRMNLATSRTAGTAWLGTLKPSVETLASYGAGGFDPQVLAQLIQALGVGAIAVGVNR